MPDPGHLEHLDRLHDGVQALRGLSHLLLQAEPHVEAAALLGPVLLVIVERIGPAADALVGIPPIPPR